MIRPLALAPLLLTLACAHQQRPSQPLPELPRYSLQSRLADAPEDEGSGGYVASVPYYVAHETLAQAEAPVGADGWLARAYNYTATAPQGTATSSCLVEGSTGTSGVCLGGFPSADNAAAYLGITPSARSFNNFALNVVTGNNTVINAPQSGGGVYIRRQNASGWLWDGTALGPENTNAFDLGTSARRVRDGYFSRTLDLSTLSGSNAIVLGNGARIQLGGNGSNYLVGDGTDISTFGPLRAGRLKSDAASGNNGLEFTTNGARLDLGTGPGDYFASDGSNITAGTGISASGAIYASTGFVQSLTSSTANNQTTAPFTFDDAEGIRLSSTAALPTCTAALEGTIKRDGTTGAASTARTRMCWCTSDGAATPAYAWVNSISGTVGTTTTCAP